MQYFVITLIIILAAISPGPDFALIVKNALQHKRKAGVFSALGVSTSLLIHASYCILGLAIIISQSVLVFSIIKYLGAAYLIYIGIKCLLAKRNIKNSKTHQSANQLTTQTAFQAFTQGLLCNLLNPKAIMFILAFFTLIIKPHSSWLEQIMLGIEIALIHFIWFSFLAIIITHRHMIGFLSKIEFYIIKVMGLVLIGFGFSIALLSHITY